jgi:hypothetical protein
MTRTERLKAIATWVGIKADAGEYAHENVHHVPRDICLACGKTGTIIGDPCPDCLRLVSETLAAQAVEKVAGWRPIESAPKDGTPVLVVENIDGRQVVGEAYCCHDDESFYWAQESPHDYPEPDKIFPTHWMPLPSPPVRASSQDGG